MRKGESRSKTRVFGKQTFWSWPTSFKTKVWGFLKNCHYNDTETVEGNEQNILSGREPVDFETKVMQGYDSESLISTYFPK